MDLIAKERKRQQNTLDLIPSENIVSHNVLQALGSVLTNKYAEGQIGKRYYQGNKIVDEIEGIAKERAKKLFGAHYVNVQALSGAPANHAVYLALLKPNDKVLGLDLNSGGHLTFGMKANFSGIYYQSFSYGVEQQSGRLNYQQIRQQAQEIKPQLIICGTSAYPRDIDWKKLKETADSVGAYLLADISHTAGLVAMGYQNNPVGIADVVMATTHKTLRGPRGALIMTNDQEIAKKIDRAVFPGLQGGPHLNNIAAIAVALGETLTPGYNAYSLQVIKNAQSMADEFRKHNVRLVSDGTDNHLLLLDLKSKDLNGQQTAELLEQVGIITNKNLIPFDYGTPSAPSGIRIGTPSITTRGLKEKEAREIASFIIDVLDNPLSKAITQKVTKRVFDLCQKFPIYKDEP